MAADGSLCFAAATHVVQQRLRAPLRATTWEVGRNGRTRTSRRRRVTPVRVTPGCCAASSSSSTTEKTSVQRRYETFRWRGYDVNYRVEGPEEGLPVLLVHGFGASVNHWRKNIPAMVCTGRLRVYAIDLLGLGASEKVSPGEVTYSIELWSEQVVDFIKAQDGGTWREWSFVGNSIGSLVSLCAADALGRGRVRAIGMINCAGGMVSFRYSELNWVQAGVFWLFNKILFNGIVGPRVFDRIRKRENLAEVLKQVYVDDGAVSEELVEIIGEPAGDEGACAVFLAILNGEAGPIPERLLKQLEWCPILAVWGENDPWTPLEDGLHPGTGFQHFHSGLILERVPDAGHCVHDECPDLANGLLVPFLLEPRRR